MGKLGKQHIFRTLNQVETHLITWGDPFNCDGRDVIICVSGNPGIPDFYTDFGSALHELTKLPICVIGQAGHDKVPDKQSNELKDQEHLFNLQGQIRHKLDLIEIIDPGSTVHLIGHSIGSWLILELLHKNKLLLNRIASVNMLFPTVQRMAQSDSGRYLNNFVRRIHAIVMILYTILYLIPESILKHVIDLYLKFKCIPRHFNESVLKICSPKVGEKMLFLAYDEMDTVKALNNEIIENIKHKTFLLYSPNDAWAPVQYMDDFRKFEPDLTMQQVNIEHAFVLKSSERVAEIVSDFIKTKISKRSPY